MNKAEKHIIEIALEKVKNEDATEEQKIIVQLYNANSLRESLDCIYNTIKPLNTKDKTIKKTFENFECAIQRTYNTLYEHCGYSDQYTVANIIEYVQDFLVEKIDNSLKNNPSKKFILLTSREEMDENKWYSLREIVDIINSNNIDYNGLINKHNIALLMDECVEEEYFIEEERKTRGTRYFMKTNKEYMDLN